MFDSLIINQILGRRICLCQLASTICQAVYRYVYCLL